MSVDIPGGLSVIRKPSRKRPFGKGRDEIMVAWPPGRRRYTKYQLQNMAQVSVTLSIMDSSVA
jgi:hypothetical protein